MIETSASMRPRQWTRTQKSIRKQNEMTDDGNRISGKRRETQRQENRVLKKSWKRNEKNKFVKTPHIVLNGFLDFLI